MIEQDLYILGEINEKSLNALISQIDKNATKLNVFINSVGGIVSEGFAIYDYLKAQKKEVHTYNLGVCYSIASVIFMAGSKRYMNPNSQLMIHNPYISEVQGDAEQLKSYSEHMSKVEAKLENFYHSFTNISVAEIDAMMKAETFINAEDALRLGFATDINVLQPVAKLNTINKMDNKDEVKGLLASIKALFQKHNIKAMMPLTIVTADGEKQIYVESEDGEFAGKKAYLDEAMTQAVPDGTHQLKDGRTITTASGVITSVSEAEDKKKMEEMKAALEKAELEKKESQEITNKLQAENEELRKSFIEVLNKVENLEKTIIGKDDKTPKGGFQNTKAKGQTVQVSDNVAKLFAKKGIKIN